jgi:hypothetical protein
MALRSQGKGATAIAHQLGIGRTTVHKILQAAKIMLK